MEHKCFCTNILWCKYISVTIFFAIDSDPVLSGIRLTLLFLFPSGREDEGTYIEPYTSGEWIYIGDLEESFAWKRPDSRDDEDFPEYFQKERRNSQESTGSEKCFRKKYEAATRRMVHRKTSIEMYKRIQRKNFGKYIKFLISNFSIRFCHFYCIFVSVFLIKFVWIILFVLKTVEGES